MKYSSVNVYVLNDNIDAPLHPFDLGLVFHHWERFLDMTIFIPFDCVQMKITVPSKIILSFVRSAMVSCQRLHVKASAEGVHLKSVDPTNTLTCECFVEKLSNRDCRGRMSCELDLHMLYTVLEVCGPYVTISGSDANHTMMLKTHTGPNSCEYTLQVHNIPHCEFNEQTVYDCIVHVPVRTMVCISKSSGKVVRICCSDNILTFTSNDRHHNSTIVLENHVVKHFDVDLKVSAYHLSNVINEDTKMVVLHMSDGKVCMETGSGGTHMKYCLTTV